MPWTALHGACQLGDVAAVVAILQGHHGASDNVVNAVQEVDGYTPLHLACMHGNVVIARLLTEHGAFPNSRSRCQETPLHCAASCGMSESSDVCDVLVQRGANVNAIDRRVW